jgi:hypothetical protein
LAQHLPLVYPETLRYSTPDKVSTPDALDGDWVKVDASDDIYEVNVCFIIVSKSRNIVDLWKLQSENLLLKENVFVFFTLSFVFCSQVYVLRC